MNNYKLIRIIEGYIIVSYNEKITSENVWVFDTDYEPSIIYKTDKLFFEIGKEAFKIIASTFIPELPNIDFNNLEEEFSIINIEKLLAKINSDMWDTEQKFPLEAGFKIGFNKCLELNKDKLYTLDEVINAYKKGCNVRYEREGEAVLEKEFIQSLQPKTEFEIEIELDNDYEESMGDISIPKITNNSIKIIKIL